MWHGWLQNLPLPAVESPGARQPTSRSHLSTMCNHTMRDVFRATSGLLTVEDFLTAKGDTLKHRPRRDRPFGSSSLRMRDGEESTERRHQHTLGPRDSDPCSNLW